MTKSAALPGFSSCSKVFLIDSGFVKEGKIVNEATGQLVTGANRTIRIMSRVMIKPAFCICEKKA